MAVISIRVDHKLRIASSELPRDVRDHITRALSIPNMERQRMMEQRIWGWQQLSETIPMWSVDDVDDLVIPRGFGFDLIEGFEALDISYRISDSRTYEPKFRIGKQISLHPWQDKALSYILPAQEGIWKAPGGSGKTVGVLEAIRRVAGRSIVIVNTKDILWQWQERAHEFLGEHYPVGQIGDNIFDVSPYMTISTAQTLHSRFSELESEGFFDIFSFMCLDECHHATAETYNRLVNRFSARFRIGVSATPDKTGDFALATTVLGPIIHETLPYEVSTLVRPKVVRVPTKFEFGYKGAKGRRPSNYGPMLGKLIEDEARNNLIVKTLMKNEYQHSLVISKRLSHLDILKEKLIDAGYAGFVFTLTGKESSEDRQRIVQKASEEWPCVIFSTLADEALDIPRLDRIFLTFPQRNPGLVTQQVARIERQHPEKRDAVIYDFTDQKIGPCEAQWKIRRRQVYQERGYPIEVMRLE